MSAVLDVVLGVGLLEDNAIIEAAQGILDRVDEAGDLAHKLLSLLRGGIAPLVALLKVGLVHAAEGGLQHLQWLTIDGAHQEARVGCLLCVNGLPNLRGAQQEHGLVPHALPIANGKEQLGGALASYPLARLGKEEERGGRGG